MVGRCWWMLMGHGRLRGRLTWSTITLRWTGNKPELGATCRYLHFSWIMQAGKSNGQQD